MPEFTKDELNFIVQVLTQVSWKAGQSQSVLMSEGIINKCNIKPESKEE